jgi:hypothetical protein
LRRVLDSLNSSLNINNKKDSINTNRARVKEDVKIEAIINVIRAKAYTISLTVNYAALTEKASFNLMGSLLLTFKALDRWGKRFKIILDYGSIYDWVDS